MDPQFQLVFQFSASTKDEYEAFLQLAEKVAEALSEEPETIVDGHDFGLGEFNIFIHTNRPQDLFYKTAGFIDAERPGQLFAAGYRNFNEDDYTNLWPENSTFTVA